MMQCPLDTREKDNGSFCDLILAEITNLNMKGKT